MTGWVRPTGSERGSVGVSSFFAVIILILLLGVGIAGMRVMIGQGDLSAASRAGARAAAIEHDHGDAMVAAARAVDGEIARAGLACESHAMTFDTPVGDFVPGGIVTITVTCETSFDGLYAPWAGGPKTLTATSSEPIDCLLGGADDEVDQCFP